MPVRLILKHHDGHAFGPNEITILMAAFEDALRVLGLTNRDDAATMIVAKRIIEFAKQGERDSDRLRDAVVASLPYERPVPADRRTGNWPVVMQ